MLGSIPSIIEIIKLILSTVKKSNFYGWVVIIMLIGMGSIGYFVYKLYEEKNKPTRFEQAVNDIDVKNVIYKALNSCGNGSYFFWTMLDEADYNKNGKYLIFRSAHGCDKDKTRFRKTKDCSIDISTDNAPLFLNKHFIGRQDLDFIESNPTMPDGVVFSELVPVYLPLIDSRGQETNHMMFIKRSAPKLYEIIRANRVAVSEAFVVKVRSKEAGKPVIYVFYFSFAKNAEKLCIRAGSHVMDVARESIKGL